MAKIIKTPARFITVCGERPNANTFFPPPPVVTSYALAFDGVNDYLQNDASTPFVQWERTQAWTFFARFKPSSSTLDSLPLFEALYRVGNNFRGLRIFSSLIIIANISGEFPNRIFCRFPMSTMEEWANLHITYNGSSAADGVNVYLENVLQSKTVVTDNLNNTIVGSNTVRINQNAANNAIGQDCIIAESSFINYVKDASERDADIAAGTQLAGTGNFLFRLPLIYKDNGTGNISTLDSTVPIPELAQNLDMTYFGYPNPLVLNTNLIEI